MIGPLLKRRAPAGARAQPGPAPRPTSAPRPPRGRPRLRLVPAGRKPAVPDFQADAIALESRKPPIIARITLYLVILFIGSAIYWASVSEIDEIVVATGKLVTTEPALVVQPLETSVIRAIDVEPGEVVRKGQRLAELDPTFTDADVDALRTQIAGLDAQIARLAAELAGQVYAAPQNATADQLAQALLSSQRAAAYAARLKDFDAQIAHASSRVTADRDQEAVLAERIAGLEQIDNMNKSLEALGSGSKLSYLQSRDVTLDIRADLSQVQGDAAEASHMLDQARAERENYVEDYRRQMLQDLVDLRQKREAAGQDLKKAELRRSMAVLVAPSDAAVLDVAQRSVGSVVQAAEPLFTLVPLNVPLEAEVEVAARDIGHLAKGDPATLKFDAFPFAEHGTIEGTVLTISHDSFAPGAAAGGAAAASTATAGGEGGDRAYYRLRIGLGRMTLTGVPSGFRLLPGMTLTADINAGRRSIISYFLYPLTRGLSESLKEP